MATQTEAPFDIVATYKHLLSEDADLTMPVAAIEALILALANTPATTVSETLDLVSKLTATLKRRIPNSISLSAGTDLFQQYLITSLQRPTRNPSSSSTPDGDFEQTRTHLIQNGKVFVERAKAARTTIASFGRHFIHDGTTVLTNGGSRVVGALLRSAASSKTPSPPSHTGPSPSAAAGIAPPRFRVIYVISSEDHDTSESTSHISALRAMDVPVAAIPPTAVAHVIDRVTQCFVGAEGVVENGGVVSRLGTFQIGMLAKQAGKPFYVVCESHKFVRLYPLGQRDLGLSQKVLDFRTGKGRVRGEDEEEEEGRGEGDEGVADMEAGDEGGEGEVKGGGREGADEKVDYTPPGLISGIITESGVLLPSAVSEELIKIWH